LRFAFVRVLVLQLPSSVGVIFAPLLIYCAPVAHGHRTNGSFGLVALSAELAQAVLTYVEGTLDAGSDRPGLELLS